MFIELNHALALGRAEPAGARGRHLEGMNTRTPVYLGDPKEVNPMCRNGIGACVWRRTRICISFRFIHYLIIWLIRSTAPANTVHTFLAPNTFISLKHQANFPPKAKISALGGKVKPFFFFFFFGDLFDPCLCICNSNSLFFFLNVLFIYCDLIVH